MREKHPKTHVLHPCRKPNPLSGCISDRTGNLVSRLRLGSSSTNTAAHRDDLSERQTRPIQAALQFFWSSVLCEFDMFNMIQPFDQQTAPEKKQWPRLRPRANAIETGSARRVQGALALASRQSAATHEDSIR